MQDGIQFDPRWREELVATSQEGKLVFELTMGELHVYFPDENRWHSSVPEWALEKFDIYKEACKKWCDGKGIPFTIAEQTFVYGID